MKIATIVGARPQFVKAAMLSRVIAEYNFKGKSPIHEVLIHTGQHYDINMSDVFFEEMGIPKPDYHLGIGGCSHGAMTGRMLEKLEEVFLKEKPDWIVIYGDTNSTLAGAIAAVKLHIPVAHVEAGLRSFNLRMPEEWNRKLADQCAALLFTPTKQGYLNLIQEGVPAEKICEVGDIMCDAAMVFKKKAEASSLILEALSLRPKQYALATVHRQENTDDPATLKSLFLGLIEVAKKLPLVLPLHPRTTKMLERAGLLDEVRRHIKLIEPVGYLDMVRLESQAQVILTDSGGVQKEAYFYQVPCVTLRTETEWVELVEHGYNRLTAVDSQSIAKAVELALASKPDWNSALYGEGRAASEILHALLAKKP